MTFFFGSPSVKRLSSILLMVGVGALSSGCGSIFNDRIDTICECENCGEREQQEYEIENQTEIDVADTYDCGDLLDTYWECNLQKYECKDNRYRDDNSECGNELDQYNECKRARSSRDPGPY
jgi:hypothetical protein